MFVFLLLVSWLVVSFVDVLMAVVSFEVVGVLAQVNCLRVGCWLVGSFVRWSVVRLVGQQVGWFVGW